MYTKRHEQLAVGLGAPTATYTLEGATHQWKTATAPVLLVGVWELVATVGGDGGGAEGDAGPTKGNKVKALGTAVMAVNAFSSRGKSRRAAAPAGGAGSTDSSARDAHADPAEACKLGVGVGVCDVRSKKASKPATLSLGGDAILAFHDALVTHIGESGRW